MFFDFIPSVEDDPDRWAAVFIAEKAVQALVVEDARELARQDVRTVRDAAMSLIRTENEHLSRQQNVNMGWIENYLDRILPATLEHLRFGEPRLLPNNRFTECIHHNPQFKAFLESEEQLVRALGSRSH